MTHKSPFQLFEDDNPTQEEAEARAQKMVDEYTPGRRERWPDVVYIVREWYGIPYEMTESNHVVCPTEAAAAAYVERTWPDAFLTSGEGSGAKEYSIKGDAYRGVSIELIPVVAR